MEEQLIISITRFTAEIIRTDSKFLFINEHYHYDNWYVLKIKRRYFNRMIKLCIDTKASYCKKTWPFFWSIWKLFHEDDKRLSGINLLIDVEDGTSIYKEVPFLLVLSFNDCCD